MLKKDTRRQLKEHGWLEIAKRHSNRTLALKRLKDQAIEAINDLTLLAEKLPTDTLKDFFNEVNFEKLVQSILYKNAHMNDLADYARRTQLASMLVKNGVDFCINQYTNKIETSAVLNELLVSQLLKAISVCNEIAFKVLLASFQSQAEQRHLVYLFDYSRIKTIGESNKNQAGDTGRFIAFCEQEYGSQFKEIRLLSRDDADNRITFNFVDQEEHYPAGSLTLDYDNRIATFVLYDGKEIRRTLVLKIEGESIHVYKKE